jgi:tetratricopeptide (TPR) repeat protein
VQEFIAGSISARSNRYPLFKQGIAMIRYQRKRIVGPSVIALMMILGGCSDPNVEKGVSCLALGDHTMAREFFARALEREPRNYEARLGMGKAFLQAAAEDERDTSAWREACRHFLAARTLRPSEAINGLLSQTWSERSRILVAHHDTITALEALTRAIEYDPKRYEPLNAAGIIYFRMGETQKAVSLLSKALALDTGNVAVLFNLGMVRWHEGDLEAARGLWLKALKRAPKDDAILYWFALAEKKLRGSGGSGAP